MKEKINKIRNTQKGITLVALVITIIVMLLLSVVSINIMQNAGLIEKVKLAKEEHRASTIQEQKELFEKEIEISKYDGSTTKTINDLLNKLEEEKLITEEEKNTIMQTGRITIGEIEIIFSEDAILPDGYTRCEYLESTGTQYINTGINPDQNTKVECVANWTFSVNTSSNPNPTLYGARSNARSFYEVLQGVNNLMFYQYGSMSPNITGATIFGRKAKYLTDGNKFYIDNTLKITAKVSTFTNMQSMCIFCLNNQGSIERFCLAKMYYFKVCDNGVLLQYLVPCLDNNGIPCMYDTVTGQTFYNQGTGEFIAGPIVE